MARLYVSQHGLHALTLDCRPTTESATALKTLTARYASRNAAGSVGYETPAAAVARDA
jgi:hypothetical protein